MTCEATHNATSLPGSADGAQPFGLLTGQTADLFGQEVARASPSARSAQAAPLATSATYGLRSSTSSASAALQASLASRLPGLLDSRGSTMYSLTWKAQATPLRRQICQLVASVRPTRESGFSGWATPTASMKVRSKAFQKGTAPAPRECLRGAIATGSGATTVYFDRQSGEFSRWMMGYPTSWLRCMPTGTQSCPK